MLRYATLKDRHGGRTVATRDISSVEQARPGQTVIAAVILWKKPPLSAI